jgi:hypothetical protein
LLYRIVATLLEYIYPKQFTNTIQRPLSGPVRVKEWTGLVARPPGRPSSLDPLQAQELIVERAGLDPDQPEVRG